MPRAVLYFNPRRISPEALKTHVLRHLQEAMARALTTKQGPVIAQECFIKTHPFSDLDLPIHVHDIELVVTAHRFRDRVKQVDDMATQLKRFLNISTEMYISCGVWVDLVDMGYAEYPDPTR